MDSAAAFNAQAATKDAYEKGLADEGTDSVVVYKSGCSLSAYGSDSRRASLQIQFTGIVSDASGADQTIASAGVTDTNVFASNINTVIASDAAAYSTVETVGAGESSLVSWAGNKCARFWRHFGTNKFPRQ
jgi:hypothetical protein